MNDLLIWLTQNPKGLATLCLVCILSSMLLIRQVTFLFKCLVTPFVEKAFYDSILKKWLGPFLSRHKIVHAFIKAQGMGDSIVDLIVHIIGTFIVVGLLSSALTAVSIYLYQLGFVFSQYFIVLVSLSAMLLWILIHNLIYFYKFAHRLK